MRRLLALILFLLPFSVSATTTVTGHISDLTGSASTTGTFARFNLRGCAGNQPRVDGVALIAPSQGGIWYKDFPVDPSGNVNGTIYSTRDATGLLGGDIECGGSKIAVWYGLVIYQNGKAGPETPIHADNTVTLNLTNVQPIISTPPPAVPGAGIVGPPGSPGPVGPMGPPGSASNPAAPANCLQYANSTVTAFAGAAGLCTPDGNALSIKGPGPWIDIGAYGGRAVLSTPATTASCNGTTSVTVASATGFQIGDGIVLYGCGASEPMTTPNAPTVQSGISDMMQVPIATLITTTGASTYHYRLVGVDKHGGLTLPGPVTTITNGLASLGYQTSTILTESLSGSVLTITLSAGTSLAASDLVQFIGSTNAALNGWGLVATSTVGGSVLTIINPTVAAPAGISSTGGTLSYLAGEQLTWAQSGGVNLNIICAERPGDGTYHNIGLSYPGAFTTATTFTDWGPTVTTAPDLPTYMTDAGGNPCNSAFTTPDYLSTTITNIVGNTFTVANSASQTAAGKTLLFDDSPSIKAAFTYANTSYNGTVLVPNATNLFYPINSYLDLSSFTTNTLRTEGILAFNETMEPPKRWTGTNVAGSNNPAQNNAAANMNIGTAWPGIYYKDTLPGGQAEFDNLSFGTLGGNQKLIVLFNPSGQGSRISNINCSTSSASDYSGICFAMGPANFNWTVDHNTFGSAGQTLVTWSPAFWLAGDPSNIANSGFETLSDINLFGRGIYATNYAAPTTLNSIYCQGCTNPVFTNQATNGAGGSFWLHQFTDDTALEPLAAFLGTNQKLDVHMDLMGALSPDVGGVPPIIQGTAPTTLDISQSAGSTTIGPTVNPNPVAYYVNQRNFNRPQYFANNSEDTGNLNYARGIDQFSNLVSSVQGFIVPLGVAVLATPTASAGGTIPLGAHTYCVQPVGINGGWGISSCQTITVSGSNQTLAFSWNAVPGVTGYVISQDGTSCLPLANNNCLGLTTLAGVTTLSYAGGSTANTVVAKMLAAGDGVSGINAAQAWAPKISAGSFQSGNGVLTPDCLPGAGCITIGGSTTPGTPTAGTAYIRYDLTGDQLLYSIDGMAEAPLTGGIAAAVNLPGQTAAIAATTLIPSAPRTSHYIVCFSAAVTTAGSVSSTLGGTNGFQIVYTSPDDSVVKTTSPVGLSNSLNTTVAATTGCGDVYAQIGTPVQFKYDYTSNAANTMAYAIHVWEQDGHN